MNKTTRPEFRFDDREVDWIPFRGFEGLDYCLLKVDAEHGQVDLLMRFSPNQNCVPHRHLGPTRTLVLEGEHRVFRTASEGTAPDDLECSVRKAGTYSSNDGETHYEGGGPEGAIILLLMTAVDGSVYDILDELQGDVARHITLEDFQRGYQRQQG